MRQLSNYYVCVPVIIAIVIATVVVVVAIAVIIGNWALVSQLVGGWLADCCGMPWLLIKIFDVLIMGVCGCWQRWQPRQQQR